VILRLLAKILLADLAIALVTGVICWLGGWRTRPDFGSGLMIGGILTIIAGGISAFGGGQIARDPTYRYIQSVMSNSLSERTKQDWQEYMGSISFLIWAGIAGLIVTVIGYLLTSAS
jgi:hypothetical protein